MRHVLAPPFIALLALPLHAGPTRLCNPEPRIHGVILETASQALLERIVRATTAPASDPALTALLGDVRGTSLHPFLSTNTTMVALDYDPADNVSEIVSRINAAPEVRSQLAYPANLNGYACFSAGYFSAKRVIVTEYHNTVLNHYFLSSSDAENHSIDSGAAGPGWTRTGESFVTYMPERCAAPIVANMVWRFYGTPGIGPNSHFFTPGPEECGGLRNSAGWTYEGPAFGADAPTAGVCPASSPRGVYRAYNMRWLQNDSNHRYTTSYVTYQQMIGRGWYGEGIAFCVPNEVQ